MSEKDILRVIVGVCVGLIILSIASSVFGLNIPSPNDWLVDWTTWVGSVVTIVVAARIFWTGAKTLQKLMTEGLPRRKRQ